jgi:hypothetical protein
MPFAFDSEGQSLDDRVTGPRRCRNLVAGSAAEKEPSAHESGDSLPGGELWLCTCLPAGGEMEPRPRLGRGVAGGDGKARTVVRALRRKPRS